MLSKFYKHGEKANGLANVKSVFLKVNGDQFSINGELKVLITAGSLTCV